MFNSRLSTLLIILLIFIITILVVVILSIMKPSEENLDVTTTSTTPLLTTSTVVRTTTTQTTLPLGNDIPLSDIQIAACKAADSGSTCNTKLEELGLVRVEDCCKYLKKCC